MFRESTGILRTGAPSGRASTGSKKTWFSLPQGFRKGFIVWGGAGVHLDLAGMSGKVVRVTQFNEMSNPRSRPHDSTTVRPIGV